MQKTFRTLTLISALSLIGLTGSAFAHSADKGTYAVDGAHSQALFTVGHLGAGHFTGRFNKVGGEIQVDGTGTGNSVKIEIETGSVDTNHTERDKHLRSPDFFNAAQFPKAIFESTKVALDAKGQGSVTGNLTLRGVTKPVTLKLQHTGAAKDPWGGYRSGYVATGTIKRSEFGVSFMPGGLSEDVDLTINLEAVKK